LKTYRDTITINDLQLSVTITKSIAIILNINSLSSLNLTLESDSQITTGIITLRLPTHSNSLVLVTGQPQIDTINTENTIIITFDFRTSLATISPLIKGLKKPRKVIKSKGYHFLKEGKEFDISKRISRDVIFKNIIEEKRSTRRGTVLLAY